MKPINKLILVNCASLILFLSSFSPLFAQNVQSAISTFVGDPVLKYGYVSFSLLDKDSGKTIATHNPHTALVPASSVKVLSCALALKELGREFTFETHLEITGTIDADGILNGDVYIRGGGDPTLGSELTPGSMPLQEVLDSWVKAISQSGIKQIKGKIIGDASYFTNEGIYDTWQWYDLGNYYACGYYGLNIYDNLYKLKYKQTATGGSPQILDHYPNVVGLEWDTSVKSGKPGTGDNAYIYGAPLQYKRNVTGTIPPGSGTFVIKGSLPDPPLTAATLLMEALEQDGVKCLGVMSSLSSPIEKSKRKVIHTHRSKPLHEIVTQTLLKSININAEAMVRICVKKSGPEPSTAAAMVYFKDYLTQLTNTAEGARLCDGSGLSPLTYIPSLGFAAALHQFSTDPKISSSIKSALPVAGISGTLKNFLSNSPAKGFIQAKTGSMEKVRSYTGYITGKSGKEYIFSLIVNNYNCSGSVMTNKSATFLESLFKAL